MAVNQGPVNDIWICKSPRCAGQCDDKVDLCQYMIVGCDVPDPAAFADVVITDDGGSDWTNAATHPFAAGEDIISVTCFDKDSTTTRYLVVRGTDADPGEVAYSDDLGATWTNVDYEAASDAHFAVDSGALFALDYKHIWLVTNGGYIFFSSDGGLNWTNQDDGNVTTEDYHAVMFANVNDGYAVATTGVVVRTVDGGLTWAACTTITSTPDINCVYVFDKDNVLIGDADGEMWRTWDAGTTWTQIYTGTDSINDIDFANAFVGFAIADDTLLRTRNGGEDWETVTVPAATEYNAVVACDENNAYIVGEDTSNDGIVVKVG